METMTPRRESDRKPVSGGRDAAALRRRLDTVLGELPLVLWSWDDEGTFTLSEGAGLKSIGLEPGEVVGRSVEDVYGDTPEILELAQRALAGEPVDAVLEVGGSFFEARLRPQPEGGDEAVVGVALDVTDHRRAERDFERLFLLNAEPLCIAGMDGGFLRVNPAFVRLLGYREADVLDSTVLDLVHPDDREATEAELARLERVGEKTGFRNRCRRATGEHVWLDWVVNPVLATRRLYCAVRDVTVPYRVELALRESEERYRTVVENAVDGIFLTDARGRFLDANPAGLEMLGCDRDELLSLDMTAFVDLRDLEIDPTRWQELAAQRAVRTERRVVRRDGATFQAEIMARRLSDGRLLGTVRDVTKRRDAEQATEATARQHEVEARIGGLALSGENLDILLRAAVLGVSDALEVEMVEVLQIAAEGDDLVLREGVGFEEGAIGSERVAPADVSPPGHDVFIEPSVVLCGGGEETPPPSRLQGHGVRCGALVAIPGQNGPWGVLGAYTRDVRRLGPQEAHHLTAVARTLADALFRSRAEDALRRSEAAYRGLVNHATHGIYRSSPDGRFLSANPALVRMLGYSSVEELLEVPVADLYVDSRERSRLLAHYVLETDEISEDVVWVRKDGTQIRVWLSGRAVHAPGGDIEALEMIVEDMTERHAVEAQLRQAQKMEAVGRFTGGVAHDFNNILTAILANVDLAITALPPDAEGPRIDLDEVRAAAERGANLIRKLMFFSRQEELQLDTVDVVEICRDVGGLLRRILPESIDIVSRFSTEPLWVRADRIAIDQIVMNLATNARDAMAEGGTLELTLEAAEPPRRGDADSSAPAGPRARLTVRDDGAGIDEKTLARIFEPFFTTKPVGRGTGLGMAMVYGLVRQQNGEIAVRSRPGEGTEVVIHLPLVEAPTRAIGEALREGDLPRGSERVLMLEDDDALQRIARRALARMGYRVECASDGEEALEILQTRGIEFDLVVADVIVPKLGGQRLYEAIERRPECPRFLFTSGYTGSASGEDWVRVRGLPFLRKPWTVSDLVLAVRDALDAA